MQTDIIREIKQISLYENHRFYFIAKYIVSNITTIPKMSIKELAKETYSSLSTINRFTRYLKLSGYKELTHLIKYFNYALIETEQKLSDNSNYKDNNIMYRTYNNIIQSIQDTFSLFLIQDKLVNEIIAMLKKAKKINIFAVGGTYNLARDFQEKLLRIGLNCIAINNFHNAYFLAKQTNEDIFNIIISYSGETQDLIKLALICKENNSRILSISKQTDNTISKIANFKLVITSNESILRTVSISSRLALMFCLDMIFYKFLLTDFNYYKENLQATSLSKF
ncbi:MAG: MurR/RpiR family transcriptional regulator [Spiroplasma sp.]